MPAIAASVAGRARVRLGEDLTRGLRLLERAGAAELPGVLREAQVIVREGYIREHRTLESMRLIAGADSQAAAYIAEQEKLLAEAQPDDERQLDASYRQRARRLGMSIEPLKPTAAELRAQSRVPVWRVRSPVDFEGVTHALEKEERSRLRIFRYSDAGDLRVPANPHFMNAYLETLAFIDGKRSIQEVRDAVSAEHGTVPLEVVEELFAAMERAGLISIQPRAQGSSKPANQRGVGSAK